MPSGASRRIPENADGRSGEHRGCRSGVIWLHSVRFAVGVSIGTAALPWQRAMGGLRSPTGGGGGKREEVVGKEEQRLTAGSVARFGQELVSDPI